MIAVTGSKRKGNAWLCSDSYIGRWRVVRGDMTQSLNFIVSNTNEVAISMVKKDTSIGYKGNIIEIKFTSDKGAVVKVIDGGVVFESFYYTEKSRRNYSEIKSMVLEAIAAIDDASRAIEEDNTCESA